MMEVLRRRRWWVEEEREGERERGVRIACVVGGRGERWGGRRRRRVAAETVGRGRRVVRRARKR